MSIIIRGMKMPISCYDCPIRKRNGMEILCPVCGETFSVADVNIFFYRLRNCPLVELPTHGRLIDAEAFRQAMYHEAFETDSPMQKWDSGCWIRYKMFERMEEVAPTIIEAEEVSE